MSEWTLSGPVLPTVQSREDQQIKKWNKNEKNRGEREKEIGEEEKGIILP